MKIYMLISLLATLALFAHWPLWDGGTPDREPQS